MKKIEEVYAPESVMLTTTQKGILAIIHNAPTPETAFEAINGSPALITARNILERLGLIVVELEANRAGLSESGRSAVVRHGLADQSGAMTDEGRAVIDAINKNSQMAESFSLLRSLI